MISNVTWVIPSKLPWDMANLRSESYVSSEGRNTKTPELKQSGHPASGAADSSSLSNNSSTFCRTCKQSFNLKYRSKIWIQALNMLKKNILCAGYNDKKSQAESLKFQGHLCGLSILHGALRFKNTCTIAIGLNGFSAKRGLF